MKISFITTVLNDKQGIKQLLNSLSKQTKLPDEVIITDAGSTDGTIKKIKKQKKSFPIPIRLIVKPEASRSEGRNLAIRRAEGKIIAVSDAGCILNKNWLENISQPLETGENQTVKGSYKPIVKNSFQECLAGFTCADIYRPISLPSSRSIAFLKSAWSRVEGYPEALNYCEDLVFAKRLQKEFGPADKANDVIVKWPQRKNLPQAFQQFFHYAYGDGQVFFSPYQSHSVKISLIFLRYLVGLILLILGFLNPLFWQNLIGAIIIYVLFSILKNINRVSWPAILYSPLIQITSDIAVMLGTISGLANTKRVYNKSDE